MGTGVPTNATTNTSTSPVWSRHATKANVGDQRLWLSIPQNRRGAAACSLVLTQVCTALSSRRGRGRRGFLSI